MFAAFYALFVERLRVQLDSYELHVGRGQLPKDGLTILHLSDLHFGGGGPYQRRKIAGLLRLLKSQQYDLVAMTGDLIHDLSGLEAVLHLVESLQPRLGGYFCPGNHDHSEYSVWGIFGHTWQASGGGRSTLREWISIPGALLTFARKIVRNELVRLPVAFNDVAAIAGELAARGIQPLINRAVPLPGGGTQVWIAGVDDLTEGESDLKRALAGIPTEALVVLLAHNPDIWLDPGAQRASLILSGHTHGGQVRLPGVGALHTQGTHLTRRRPAGWFHRGASHMFVVRGVGESIPLRFGVRPQAALIRLLPEG